MRTLRRAWWIDDPSSGSACLVDVFLDQTVRLLVQRVGDSHNKMWVHSWRIRELTPLELLAEQLDD